uniref:Uncharacterized protein n=1 Tax=Arundo donax TaxID=35708 RepID=A0A0A8Y7L0_ARUDO
MALVRRSTSSVPGAMETRTSHHCGPSSARRSRLSSSRHVRFGGFFLRRSGSWMRRSCTSSFQSVARSSRRSFRCCRLSRAVSSPPPAPPPSAEDEADRVTDTGSVDGDAAAREQRHGRRRSG